jgi:hypothetical protein
VAAPDLHIHSTASDGRLTPEQIVALALERGVPAIAITDHDSIDGVGPALHAAEGTPLTVIPGVELSAAVGARGIHILGYCIDHTDPVLLDRLVELRATRLERARRIVDALADTGIEVTLDDVLALAGDGAVGRAHVAQVIVEAGHASSISDAFYRLLGEGRPAFVPKPLPEPREVVSWIHEAGGIAVVAHPALSKIDDLLPLLVEAGIAGIEAYHARHDAPTCARYARLAAEYGLIATGGSDFHTGDDRDDSLGSAPVPPEAVDHVLAACRTRRGVA